MVLSGYREFPSSVKPEKDQAAGMLGFWCLRNRIGSLAVLGFMGISGVPVRIITACAWHVTLSILYYS